MADNLLGARIARVQEELRTASDGRYSAPRLIAVTKTHPVDMILPLRNHGLLDIAENRVQEVTEKWPFLQQEGEKSFRVHLIGRLQTNKVKYIMDKVCMIQSLDRMELAREIDRQAQRHGVCMPVLIQVSPAGEPQKGGLPPEQVFPFLREICHMDGLHAEGLMAVMPHTEDQAYLSVLFRQMRELYEKVRQDAPEGTEIRELSMGMSGDYQIAAAYGATMVRLGSALFGPRNYPVQMQ